MTQRDRVLAYLRNVGSLTQTEAAREIGCLRLPSRVNELKKMGHRITKKMVPMINRYGEKTHVARYSLHEDKLL